MTNLLFAILVTSNLVSHPCSGGVPGGKCNYCQDDLVDQYGIPLGFAKRVPEHIGRIGFDCDWIVTTQYLPVVEMPAPKP